MGDTAFTASAHKIAAGLVDMGHEARVVSLDDFFKNFTDYPLLENGEKDYESVETIDAVTFNRCLREILSERRTRLPVFDFASQTRSAETRELVLPRGGTVIFEGIHAFNPVLFAGVSMENVLKVYAGLRTEYRMADGMLKTRELRIVRRLLRDLRFRSYEVERTLSIWSQICSGEEKWIKVFKPDADCLLNTSFDYEPGLYAPLLAQLAAEPTSGGEYRETLLKLCDEFAAFAPVNEKDIPADSMLREFIG